MLAYRAIKSNSNNRAVAARAGHERGRISNAVALLVTLKFHAEGDAGCQIGDSFTEVSRSMGSPPDELRQVAAQPSGYPALVADEVARRLLVAVGANRLRGSGELNRSPGARRSAVPQLIAVWVPPHPIGDASEGCDASECLGDLRPQGLVDLASSERLLLRCGRQLHLAGRRRIEANGRHAVGSADGRVALPFAHLVGRRMRRVDKDRQPEQSTTARYNVARPFGALIRDGGGEREATRGQTNRRGCQQGFDVAAGAVFAFAILNARRHARPCARLPTYVAITAIAPITTIPIRFTLSSLMTVVTRNDGSVRFHPDRLC